VRGKLAGLPGHPPEFSPEYDDCARIARQHGIALRAVCDQVQQSYLEHGSTPP
jgi:uncharacterized protein (DUF111 family)